MELNGGFSTLLVIASGICWSIVYIESVRRGFKEKTYCMPLFALGLNIVWEGMYAYIDLAIHHSTVQGIANACWFILDIFILITWFRFGKEEFKTETEQKWFIPWTILALATCIVVQVLFVVEFGDVEGEKYSAYLQNIIMSIAFLYMLNDRRSSRGQSMVIAVCKWIGTLTPTIFGAMEGNNFILVTGIICFIFDLIYIIALHKVQKDEAAGTVKTAA